LTSSQSGTRAHAENILKDCVKNRVVYVSTAEKAVSKLINAEQRKVQPIIDSLRSISFEPGGNAQRSVSTIPLHKAHQKSPTKVKASVPFQRAIKDSPARSKTSSGLSRHSRDRSSIGQRKRSISRSHRESITGSKQSYDQPDLVSDLLNDPAFHPLRSESAIVISKVNRLSKQREHVPEYPENPSGKDIFADLKKTWAPLLPNASVELLFPSDGMRVQDDALVGCKLLSRAIDLIVDNKEEALIFEQIDLVIRWYSFALCSRETTKGMQSLISFLSKFSSMLRNQQYQLTDSESLMLLPYLLEKAGAAKVRAN
jgi:hypothetical protein